MREPRLALILVISGLLTSGCGSSSHNITITVESATFQQTPHYSRSIDILLGAELKLILHSNGTTGYAWTNPAELSEPSVLEQTGHRYVIRPDPLAGEAGHEVFTFATNREGICAVFLEYKRPSGGEVSYTCTLNVRVL